jgi:hypothetical protein
MEVLFLHYPFRSTLLKVSICTGKDLEPNSSRTLQQGAATIALAAIDSSLKSEYPRTKTDRFADICKGKSPAYLFECKVKIAKEYATKEENVQKLWDLGNTLVGEKFAL